MKKLMKDPQVKMKIKQNFIIKLIVSFLQITYFLELIDLEKS